LLIGFVTIGPLLFEDYFGRSIFVLPSHDVIREMLPEWHGPVQFVLHSIFSPVLYLALAGVVVAWYLYLRNPALPDAIRERSGVLYTLLVRKYLLDDLAERMIPAGTKLVGNALWRIGDAAVIDGAVVNGSARLVGLASGVMSGLQTGRLYSYAFVMIIGLALIVGWLILRSIGL
jgi:NADH-quinone oxidoreductase subunit L